MYNIQNELFPEWDPDNVISTGKIPEIINLTRFLKSFWILYIDQIIVYDTFYSKLTFYIIKDRCQMHTLKVFRSGQAWLSAKDLFYPFFGNANSPTQQ
jgi:hypothetical protein